MFVIGTAGHVDHGKTALINALTGMDPDRLQEEKDRGMTIDLGFAWLKLSNETEISLIDVPGHEKFVNNMLAGIGSIDLAMLIISLEESIMPQTLEHLAILNLLNVQKGMVVLTKKDLVDEEWVELVKADVEELITGTVFETSNIYCVSAKSGEGIEGLLSGIEELLSSTILRRDIHKPRLPIDRSFTVSGFGTVVTGTLIDGTLNVGEEMELSPSGRKVRIRGLQTHKKSEDVAYPGTRVAANISGVNHLDISRGEVLTVPDWIKPSEAFDVYLSVLDAIPNPLRHNMHVTLHVGSTEVVSVLRLLETDSIDAGERTWAQIKPVHPVPILKGDYCVIRSNMTTLGGGLVVAANAKRHKRKDSQTVDRLNSLLSDSTKDIVFNTVNESNFLIGIQSISEISNIEIDTVISELGILIDEKLILSTSDEIVNSDFITINNWNELFNNVKKILSKYHSDYPLRKGVPKEFLRNQLNITSTIYNQVLQLLNIKNVIVEEASFIKLPDHFPNLSEQQSIKVKEFIDLLNKDPFASSSELIEDHILEFLVDQKKIVRLDDKILLSYSVYQRIVGKVQQILSDKGEITVAGLRDEFATSRKYAIAILDYMDQQQITKRVGDIRVFR
ncbi:MAG: selenocysteine-specific translation elongation factor [Chloroflexi bacterium]|nr:selenocysteine-specific translation elongation factor [Chloroflexota bacterium]